MTNKSTNSEYIGSKLVIDKELHQKLDEILNREHEEVTESHDEIIALVREHDAKSSFAVTGIGKEIRADERQRCIDALRDELIMTGNHEYQDGLIMKLVKKLEALGEQDE